MENNAEYVEIRTTVPEDLDAKRLADSLVREKLAACVQYHQIKSIYRWNANIEEAQEYSVVAKTTAALSERTVEFIRSAHTYDLPQILVVPIIGGNQAYLEWIDRETE